MAHEELSQWSGNRFTNPLYYKSQHGPSVSPQHEETLSPRLRQSLRRPSGLRQQSVGTLPKRRFSEGSNFS